MELTVRPATPADKPAIVAISAQIWEGEDYIPRVIDAWLVSSEGEVAVALLGARLAGFARVSFPFPGYAWMEGIRTDPALQNRGVGRAITRYLLERARQGGAERAGLSTYIENYASLHIIEASGFRRVASFIFLTAEAGSPALAAARQATEAVDVPAVEAIPFIARSHFLEQAGGYIPHNWKHYPFDRGPEAILRKMSYVGGIRRGGQLVALLCLGSPDERSGNQMVAFLDGEPPEVDALLRHALYLGRSSREFSAAAPGGFGQPPVMLDVARTLGFTPWNDFAPDVFVYERDLQGL